MEVKTDKQRENRKKYPFICAWGARLGSFQYYIDGEIERAMFDRASTRAIYKDNNGKWHTIDDVQNPEAKQFCLAWVEKNRRM
jgi:hypothetical protein